MRDFGSGQSEWKMYVADLDADHCSQLFEYFTFLDEKDHNIC